MTIANDVPNKRVIDNVTGQYMTWKTENREIGTMYFVLHGSDGAGLLGAIVRNIAINETGKGGAATLVRFVLEKTWIPSGVEVRPAYFYGDHDLIDKLRQYLEVWKYFGGVKTPDPRFEFIDGRSIEEGSK